MVSSEIHLRCWTLQEEEQHPSGVLPASLWDSQEHLDRGRLEPGAHEASLLAGVSGYVEGCS